MTTKLFPRATGWRRVLLVSLAAGVSATLLAALAGLAVAGADAALSASLGGMIVVVFSALSLLLVDIAERVVPAQAITAFMLGFAVKIILLAVVLTSVPAPGWIVPGWTLFPAAGVVVVWQIAEITAFMRMRIAVDPEEG
ncbi:MULTISPECIES: ATP synthase subunit I [Nesterenkonia]|uniref:ATP synthase protein I n=1 Tax=Nesterenkonia xinjiangensis TaxID=225327 RepID=A0A7Z0GIL1_9MICC|nr:MULTISPECIES: ATP synthase subunit I [Nesterenkonia]MDZ5078638.1 ATP synthase subunit I [Nesterenkonia sp. HG001]NYJ76665.1 ATP synthase protein I [Nesterenkonia xinjiangensis]